MEDIEGRFSSKALEDFKLIDMAVGGDEKAYAKLLQRYRRPVYHVILKMVRNVDDAEDLTIESFAKAFRSLHRFKKDFTFSTWLFRIATNNTIDFLRKKKLNTLSIENTYTDDNGESARLEPALGAGTEECKQDVGARVTGIAGDSRAQAGKVWGSSLRLCRDTPVEVGRIGQGAAAREIDSDDRP